MPKTKGAINAYDAYALLNRRKLYPGQLGEVLVDALGAKKIACISDTTDVLVEPDIGTPSVAYTIEKANLGPEVEVIQSDYKEFHYLTDKDFEDFEYPQFGAHSPQNLHETRREYTKIDSTDESELATLRGSDVILGRSCMCACEGNGKLCGGIGISAEEQQRFLESLVRLNPSLIVLSASPATFSPTFPEESAKGKDAQLMYKEAKENLRLACENLNRNEDSPYRYELVEPSEHFGHLLTDPQNENGYMLVAYDKNKIDFQLTTVSLEKEREMARIEQVDTTSDSAELTQKFRKIMKSDYLDPEAKPSAPSLDTKV